MILNLVRLPSLLEPLSERFVAAKEHIEQVLRELPPSLVDGQVQKAASAFINLGSGDDGIFALRRAELQQNAAAQSTLTGSRALAVQLGSDGAEAQCMVGAGLPTCWSVASGRKCALNSQELVDELGRAVDVAEAEHPKRVPFGIIDRLGGIRPVQAHRLDAQS